MTNSNNKNLKSIGIDVSKPRLDVYFENSQSHQSFENSDAGIKTLLEALALQTPHRIILEPSGGYERDILYRLIECELPVSLVHARSVRHFALAKGLLAKTDKIDSRILAQYGSVFSPDLTCVPSEARQELSCYVRRRFHYISLITSEKNRREKSRDTWVQEDIDEVLAFLKKKLDALEAEIARLVSSDELKDESKVLMDVKGVAQTTTATLLGLLPELGKIGNPQIAKLVGVAPMNRESGGWKGQRSIQGGRSAVRKVLYMATIVATVYNPVIRSYYQKLKSQGKCTKVALVAAMRKLLIILNGRMKNYYSGLKVY